VALGLDLRVGLEDLSVRPDDVGDPLRETRAGRIGGAVGDPDLPIDVAEQGKRIFELPGEVGVFLDGVERDAPDLRVLLLELGVEVAEPATLDRSAGGVGLGVEPQHDGLPPLAGETDLSAVVVENFEIGGRVAGSQHASFSFLAERFLEENRERANEG
jgi:hypothetical protein